MASIPTLVSVTVGMLQVFMIFLLVLSLRRQTIDNKYLAGKIAFVAPMAITNQSQESEC